MTGNYNDDSGSVAIVINKKLASVTPIAASKVIGSTDPALTGTLTGFLLADNVTATYSRTSGETVQGSPYKISAILSPSGILTNYDLTYNTADFSIRYTYSDVLQPINTDGSSIFKLGSTIPVKFELKDSGGNFILSAVASIRYAKTGIGITGDEFEAISTSAATSGNLFRLTGNQYIFNLGTKAIKTGPGTYELRITLDDGTVNKVTISLK